MAINIDNHGSGEQKLRKDKRNAQKEAKLYRVMWRE